MHLAIDAGMGGFGLSHDSFGARMGGTPERLYKCTQENLQVSSTTRPCLSQTGAGWCLTSEEGRGLGSVVDTPRVFDQGHLPLVPPARPHLHAHLSHGCALAFGSRQATESVGGQNDAPFQEPSQRKPETHLWQGSKDAVPRAPRVQCWG